MLGYQTLDTTLLVHHWECEWQESQTCLTSTAGIPTSFKDGALFYATTLPLLLPPPPLQKPGGFFPLPDALAFVPCSQVSFSERVSVALIAARLLCYRLLATAAAARGGGSGAAGAGAALLLLVVVAAAAVGAGSKFSIQNRFRSH